MVVDLATKYRPASLADVYGQTFPCRFLRSVVNNLDKDPPRYFGLWGPFGCGKTSIVRAFYADLSSKVPNCLYDELDSSERYLQENFTEIKNLIFSEIPGYRVVVFDEAHLLSSAVLQQLLKVLEDYRGRLFLFFATTNPEMLPDPLISRLYSFTLESFSSDQLIEYGKSILAKENIELSDEVVRVAVINSNGHIRTLLKNFDMAIFMGSDEFIKTYSSEWSAVESYVFDLTRSDMEIVKELYSYHPVKLRSMLVFVLREKVINPDSERYNTIYPSSVSSKIFMGFQKIFGVVKEPDDIYSALIIFRQLLHSLAKKGA